MNMVKQLSIAIFSFMILDFAWLGFVVRDFNLRQLSQIARIEDGKIQILYAPALATYILMALAVVLFVLPRIQATDAWWLIFSWGALMGLIVYGVFDMTNLAILKNYPVPFLLADMAWGTFAYGAVTLITYKL